MVPFQFLAFHITLESFEFNSLVFKYSNLYPISSMVRLG